MTGSVKRVGVVGVGHQATEDHLPAVEACPRTELRAVCDIDAATGSPVAARYGVPFYESVDVMLHDEDLDFVVVTVPHGVHRDVTERAIRAGVHVLKEKPFAVSAADARHLQQLADAHGIQVMTTLQRRFNPTYTSFFQLADQIGTPFAVDVQYTLGVERPDEGWRGQRAIAGGGCLIDMGYHMLDLLIWYLGLPDRLAATISSRAIPGQEYDAEDTANVLMTWDSGLHGTMRISRAMPPKTERFRLVGTDGTIEIERGVIRRFRRDGELLEELRRLGAWAPAAVSQLEFFCDVVDGRAENHGSPGYHLQHTTFIDAAYRAAATGHVVDIKGALV